VWETSLIHNCFSILTVLSLRVFTTRYWSAYPLLYFISRLHVQSCRTRMCRNGCDLCLVSSSATSTLHFLSSWDQTLLKGWVWDVYGRKDVMVATYYDLSTFPSYWIFNQPWNGWESWISIKLFLHSTYIVVESFDLSVHDTIELASILVKFLSVLSFICNNYYIKFLEEIKT
jgi:hypothetical protein